MTAQQTFPPEAGAVELDDRTLAVRAQEGDIASLERLFRRHQQAMYRVALRILDDRGDAEDAVQEAFVSAWRGINSYRGDAAFSSWLYRIVTNRSFNMTRSRRHRFTVPVDTAESQVPASTHHSPEAAAAVGAERDALQRALAGLPVEQRACWVLRENDGLGYDEIADVVGLSPDAVRGKIHRARQSLVQAMGAWR